MSTAVVVPLFNGATFVGDTLNTVLRQTRPPEEIVVVDDGSTDGSPGVVARFGDVRLLCNPTETGAAARNHGLAHTRAELVAFLDQDDLWHPTHLERLEEALFRHPDAPAAVSRMNEFADGRPVRFDPRERGFTPLDPWAGFPAECRVPGPSSVLVRRSAALAAGGFTPAYAGCADLHFWLKASVRSAFVRVETRTAAKRQHPLQHSMVILHEGLRNLTRFVDAMESALAFRRERRPDDPARAELEQRLTLARATEAFAAGALGGDAETARSAAEVLERGFASDPVVHPDVLFGFWLRTLVPGENRRAHRRARFELLRTFHDALPAGAPRTRRLLLAYAGRKRFPVGRFLDDLVHLRRRDLGYELRLLARYVDPLSAGRRSR